MHCRTAFLAFLLLITCATDLLAADLPSTQPAKALTRFPTFGVAFELPGGWTEIPREKSGRIGQWISADSKPDAMQSLIMIETGRSGGNTPDLFAKGLARNFGGIVLDEPTTLGGEPALRVRADNHDDEVAPTEAVVCVRAGNVYLVMGGTKKGRSVQKEIDAVAASWKWTDLQKPASQLELHAAPFAAFDGSVRLNAPRMMHQNPADDPDAQLDLALYNLARNTADFRATLTLVSLEKGETLENACERFMKDVTGRYKFVKEGPAWQPRKAATTRFMTGVVEAARPQPAETDTLHHQWALVSLGEQSAKVVLIHFSHEAETDEERQKFEQSAEQIVISVEPVKK
ncbi:hypothetical protein [Humisphaera borealis]|uniref:DUF1795 domain-containing protein n=1 Tax=Humisphaera borealis TaxID=2807512 RepID=A0A7M2X0J8_9BACT|nr:hypothetical protein [Humisphaera borealis]QOV91286.1 hypothetical protein IPV69_07995 [Humisphaera borealis]